MGIMFLMSDFVGALTLSESPEGLVVAGEIDSATVDVLARALRSANGGTADLVLSMADVQFIDSSGLRVLIEAHQEAENEGRKLIIDQPSAIVARLLEISGLTTHLHIRPAHAETA